MALTETLKELPIYSAEVVGILEKLADFHEESHNTAQYVNTLKLLLTNLTDERVLGLESKEKDRCAAKALLVSQKLADHYISKNNIVDAARQYNWIIENSIKPMPKNAHATPPIEIQPWGNLRQVGCALEQMGTIYAKQNMFDYAIASYARALELLEQDDLENREKKRQKASLFLNLGQCFREIKQFEAAEKHIKYALELSENESDLSEFATQSLGLLYQDQVKK